jgi:hypothetical protein
MHRSDLAVATITLARDPAEEELLLRSLTLLSERGWPVFVADGGSPDRFVARIGALEHVVLVAPARRGLVAQVDASVRAACASGALRVLYTEPDKHDFFAHRLDGFVRDASVASGVAIASRSDAAFATFPPMQRTAETAINAVCARLVGRDGDYCYGPFLLDPALALHFDAIPDDLGWGWRFVMFVAAHRAGLGVELVEGAFECPADQRDESERERLYRISQLEQNVRGVLTGWHVQEHSTSSNHR